MSFIADLHVHSGYSRATSKAMCPSGLWRWCQMKGIRVVGTGDFTHPEYFRELKDSLEPAEDGLFRLKKKHREGDVPASCFSEVSFILQAEISSIYKKNGRTRKVHSIVLAPGLTEASKLNEKLDAIGNIKSDGRPILGLDAKELLRIVLDVSPECMVIPAHAWTPHFSVFGAVSGFDSLQECYDELTPHIHAIETGLSSDPPMNRRLSMLDNITLISNSDAHSPAKLGREANLFNTGMSYGSMTEALKTGEGFGGTIEFYPEQGKYHVDGHRKCNVSMEPGETRKAGFICPECGRKLTVGVMHRVEDLADREEPAPSEFRYIVPLAELIAEVMGRGVNTKGVQGRYMDTLSALGPEFRVLLDTSLEDIKKASGEDIADAVAKMRSGDLYIEPGYDGEFGVISLDKKPPKPRKIKKVKTNKDDMLF
ncbi:MAG: DNA helicase UvrD [Thermodesulfovibrionales bacterium]|nr:DNA helicase UvrD [Thermodesulfovibrionales bacterium]